MTYEGGTLHFMLQQSNNTTPSSTVEKNKSIIENEPTVCILTILSRGSEKGFGRLPSKQQ